MEGLIYCVLVLNPQGLERAVDADIRHIEISISASDTHSRKNTGMTYSDALEAAVTMVHRAPSAGLKIRAGIQ